MVWKSWIIAAALFPSLLLGQWGKAPYNAEGYITMAFGKTIGVDQNYTQAGLWGAYFKDRDFYFADIAWDHLNNGTNGVNLGGGFRFGNPARGSGFHLYGDWLDTRHKNLFQISAGCDYWFCSWLFDLELYVPLKSRFELGKKVCLYPGGFQFLSRETLFAYRLATFTIGKEWNLLRCGYFNLYALPKWGPYWISSPKDRSSYGGLFELDLIYNNLLSLKGLLTYDKIFKTRFQALLTLTIPFEDISAVICRCFSSFYSRPDRFPIIASRKKQHCTFNW